MRCTIVVRVAAAGLITVFSSTSALCQANGRCYIDTSCSSAMQWGVGDSGSGDCVSAFTCTELWKCADGPIVGSCGGGSTDCAFSPGCGADVQTCFNGFCTSLSGCTDRIKLDGYSFDPGPNQCSCVGNPPAAGPFCSENSLAVYLRGSGTGVVTSSPAGIDCPSDCVETFPISTSVALDAIPAPGSSFSGWGGSPICSSGDLSLELAHSCTAYFSEGPAWVALGDSYSSGTGTNEYRIDWNSDGDTEDPGEETKGYWKTDGNDCRRSPYAYWYLETPSNPVRATHSFACHGSLTSNIEIGGSAPESANGQAPDTVAQLDREPIDQNTDLITITIGGNDLGFAEIIMRCYRNSSDCTQDRPFESEGDLRTLPELVDARLPIVESLASQTLSDIRQAAPNARIVLLGYPKLFLEGPDVAACIGDNGFDPVERHWLNTVADDLNDRLQQAASGGFVNVDTRDYFGGHALCSADSYITNQNQITSGYHPNVRGHHFGYRRALDATLAQPANPQSHATAPDAPRRTGALSGIDHPGTADPSFGSLDVSVVPGSCGDDIQALGGGEQVVVSGVGFQSEAIIELEIAGDGQVIGLGSVSASEDGSFSIPAVLPTTIAPGDLPPEIAHS